MGFIKKKVNYFLFFIIIVSVLFISGCVQQPESASVPVEDEQVEEAGLQIFIKDVGFPEIKYLQPTIKEIQLQDEYKNWIKIYINPEGETLKLTPDGAEILLDTVNLKAGTYINTRLKVSTIDVEVDVNRDGDTEDKHVEIVLTEEEFNSLPAKDKPSSVKPSAPDKPEAPDQPEAPSKPNKSEGGITGAATTDTGDDKPEKPSKPDEPNQPPEPDQPLEPTGNGAPYRIENGLVYMGEYLDELHSVDINDYITPHFDDKFVYGGSGGKIIYDFTLHPLYPQDQQISVDVLVIPSPPKPTTVIFDDFNGATIGEGFGDLTYEDSLPDQDKAIDLGKGDYIKYSFSPWYTWDGVHSWDRNEASSGELTEGSIGVLVNPRQYTGISLGERGKPQGILTFEWSDSASALGSGYILHLGFTEDGKLTYSNWGGNLAYPLVGKTTIPLNKWTHVAVSWGPKGTNLYVNGKVDVSTTKNMWPAFSGNTQYVYLNYWGDSDFGRVDDLHILNIAEPPIIIPPAINETKCVEEGSSNAFYLGAPSCCDKLVSISCDNPDEEGNCMLCKGAFYCTKCGDGACGLGENKCNCPKDCSENITKNVTAGVIITSFTCNWNSNTNNCFRAVVKGTARGPVGTRLELPILVWSDDNFDCGSWKHSTGALVTVGHTCSRREGDPDTMNWTVDTGGNECPAKYGFSNNRKYTVKVYKDNEIYPLAQDNKSVTCQ
ncbi:MAG: LamG-like jellyroll fold domain-containing protein [Nanoarchaeota archaeon]